MRWLNRHALVELPRQVNQANAQAVGEQLQALVPRDLLVLIVDMRGTTVCDHACGEVLAHVYQRAVVTGTDLRLVVSADSVRHVLCMTGLDRLTPVFDSIGAAVAATTPAEMPSAAAAAGWPLPRRRRATADRGRTRGDVGVEIATLDHDGVIVWVNRAWQQFTAANGGNPACTGPGVSYLDVCAAAGDDPVSRQVAATIRGALAGDLPGVLSIEVPCHSPETARWFDVLISPRRDEDGEPVGATVTLSLNRSQTPT
ncbi:MAG: PAS domain-containing protein [Actinobacteria bacterium]|nr:PAS domain-containing protein [Actinomycetota bacterium]